jgi:Protein of unknown function (DUF4231)
MARRRSYPQWLEREFESLIEDLELEPQQKRFLRSRWLDQVLWLERKATRARNLYYGLRLTTVVGALLVPAFVSLSIANDTLDDAVTVVTWVISLVVAVSAALEQFFHFGDRWRSYRRTVERLKAEGWLFLQLSGRYAADGATHEAAYPAFATRTERLIASDLDSFLTEVAVERERTAEAE